MNNLKKMKNVLIFFWLTTWLIISADMQKIIIIITIIMHFCIWQRCISSPVTCCVLLLETTAKCITNTMGVKIFCGKAIDPCCKIVRVRFISRKGGCCWLRFMSRDSQSNHWVSLGMKELIQPRLFDSPWG